MPEFWLVDLESAAIEIYRGPRLTGWSERWVAGKGGRAAPAAFPDVELAVTEILG